MNIKKEINLINSIVFNAVKHGADGGGSYDSNLDGLTQVLNVWIKEKGLTDYVVLEVDITCDYGGWRTIWTVPQIVEDRI